MLNKILKAIIISSIGLFIFTGCTDGGPKLPDTARYNISKVKVKLSTLNPDKDDKLKQPLYPSEDEITSTVKTNLKLFLKKQNIVCKTGLECLDIQVYLDYRRQYILNSYSITVPHYSYTILVKRGKEAIVILKTEDSTFETGFIRNVKILASIGSKEINKEVEVEDLNKILLYIKHDIKKLIN